MKRIIFLGFPGSGKGTQSVLLGQQFDIFTLSTGELFRSIVKDSQDDEVANQIKLLINQGELVSDELTFEVIKKSLPKGSESWILDGFPRNVNQAELLENFSSPTDVVLIDVPEKIIFQRLTGRRIAKKSGKLYNIYLNPPKQDGICDETGELLEIRTDDIPEIVEKRLNVYKKETFPLIEYYQKKGILHIIPGDLPIFQVQQHLKEALQLND
ncbi:MAG: adenylate kinase family protein [Brevinemataceae bacterium]